MCGITGILNSDAALAVDPETVRRMTRTLYSRGPDSEGYYVSGPIGLGHRRLKVIDLSDAAAQPMSNEDGTVWIVYNGEVFNYQELRQELEVKGHRFRSQSDTEVLIHLYEEDGVTMLQKLRGMFAFAIWDSRKKQLFLARDRVGEKPLVWCQVNGKFLFGSEIKALLTFPDLQRRISPDGLGSLFAYTFSIPGPRSIFQGVHKLRPARYMLVRNGLVQIQRYWKPDGRRTPQLDETEYTERFCQLFEESVRLRLRSDVPVGSMFSGGVDSSLITAIAARHLKEPIKTFAIGKSTDHEDPELVRSREVAALIGTDHQGFETPLNMIDRLPAIIARADEPYSLYPALWSDFLCEKMRDHATVLLAGNGADEIFGGYRSYPRVRRLNDWYAFSEGLPRGLLRAALDRLPKSENAEGNGGLFKDQLHKLSLSPGERIAYGTSQRLARIARPLFHSNFWEEISRDSITDIVQEVYEEANAHNHLNAWNYTSLQLTEAHGATTMSDLIGMGHGLEIRSPFLDHKLIEFSTTLPARMKVRGYRNVRGCKHIVKRAACRYLPESVVYAKKYGYGYSIPFHHWLAEQYAPLVDRFVLDGGIRKSGIFNPKAVGELVLRHRATRNMDDAMCVNILLTLEIWNSIYMENQRPEDIDMSQ